MKTSGKTSTPAIPAITVQGFSRARVKKREKAPKLRIGGKEITFLS